MGNVNIIKIIKSKDVHKVITTVAAQGLLSVTHFFTSIAIARFALKEEYGLYVLLFSLIGVFAGYHEGMISVPLMVSVNEKKDDCRVKYVSSLIVGRYYLLLPVVFISAAAVSIYGNYIIKDYRYGLYSIVMIAVILEFITKEFFRTIHFTLLNTNTIFLMDLLLSVVVFAGLFLLILLEKVSAFTGLLVLSVGYTISHIYGKIKSPYQASKDLEIKKVLIENWQQGKWMILGITSSLLKNRSYVYIVTGILGLGALAEVSASRLFLIPFILLYQSVNKIMIAKGSLMVANNEDHKFKVFLLYFLCGLIGLLGIYMVIILIMADYLIGYLGEQYAHTKGLILMWGVYVLICAVRAMFGTAIIVHKRFKKQAKYDVIGTLAVILASVTLILWLGKVGAIYALILGEIIVLALYYKLFTNTGNNVVSDKVMIDEFGATI